jgi:hypothetical protein
LGVNLKKGKRKEKGEKESKGIKKSQKGEKKGANINTIVGRGYKKNIFGGNKVFKPEYRPLQSLQYS